MKRITFILVAWAVVMTLSQCKKEEPVLPNNTDDSVAITLNVKGNSRAIVNTDSGSVSFENQDKIYVACAGKYVGTLTYSVANQNFSGTISNATSGELLHFYFLGNVIPGEQLVAGSTTQCSIDISDQSQNYTNGNWHLPVLSYGVSNEPYGSQSSYSSILENKCALVKFNVNTSSTEDIYVTDLNHLVTISFSNSSFEYGSNGNGYINIGAGSGEKWCILLPQDAVEAGQMGTAFSNGYTGNHGAIPAISENSFITMGINVTVTTELGNGETPIGTVCGRFSVNENGNQVYFSKGNLQYQASTNTWRLADRQWDYVGTQTPDQYGYFGGTVNGSSNTSISQDYSGWIDLFGWGTSGYDHGANCYQPWSTSVMASNYYAYGQYSYNLYDQSGQADWGYNPIENGGNQENQWRTLSIDEWQYLLNVRSTPSGYRFAKAKVNGVNGLILVPDDWQLNYYQFNSPNQTNASYTSNVFVEESGEWEALQSNGAVFLPAAGSRSNTSVFNASMNGYYCSSSVSGSYYYGYKPRSLSFSGSNIFTGNNERFLGCSVRLVQDCPAE